MLQSHNMAGATTTASTYGSWSPPHCLQFISSIILAISFSFSASAFCSICIDLIKLLLDDWNNRSAFDIPGSQTPRELTGEALSEVRIVQDDVCAICLDKHNRSKKLFCGHVFCNDCISLALTRDDRCPHCRRNIFEAQSRSKKRLTKQWRDRQLQLVIDACVCGLFSALVASTLAVVKIGGGFGSSISRCLGTDVVILADIGLMLLLAEMVYLVYLPMASAGWVRQFQGFVVALACTILLVAFDLYPAGTCVSKK